MDIKKEIQKVEIGAFFEACKERAKAMPEIEFGDYVQAFTKVNESLLRGGKDINNLSIDLCAMACKLSLYGDPKLNKILELKPFNFKKDGE